MWLSDPVGTTLELLRGTRDCLRTSREDAGKLRECLACTKKTIEQTEALLLRSDEAIGDFTTLRHLGKVVNDH